MLITLFINLVFLCFKYTKGVDPDCDEDYEKIDGSDLCKSHDSLELIHPCLKHHAIQAYAISKTSETKFWLGQPSIRSEGAHLCLPDPCRKQTPQHPRRCIVAEKLGSTCLRPTKSANISFKFLKGFKLDYDFTDCNSDAEYYILRFERLDDASRTTNALVAFTCQYIGCNLVQVRHIQRRSEQVKYIFYISTNASTVPATEQSNSKKYHILRVQDAAGRMVPLEKKFKSGLDDDLVKRTTIKAWNFSHSLELGLAVSSIFETIREPKKYAKNIWTFRGYKANIVGQCLNCANVLKNKACYLVTENIGLESTPCDSNKTAHSSFIQPKGDWPNLKAPFRHNTALKEFSDGLHSKIVQDHLHIVRITDFDRFNKNATKLIAYTCQYLECDLVQIIPHEKRNIVVYVKLVDNKEEIKTVSKPGFHLLEITTTQLVQIDHEFISKPDRFCLSENCLDKKTHAQKFDKSKTMSRRKMHLYGYLGLAGAIDLSGGATWMTAWLMDDWIKTVLEQPVLPRFMNTIYLAPDRMPITYQFTGTDTRWTTSDMELVRTVLSDIQDRTCLNFKSGNRMRNGFHIDFHSLNRSSKLMLGWYNAQETDNEFGIPKFTGLVLQWSNGIPSSKKLIVAILHSLGFIFRPSDTMRKQFFSEVQTVDQLKSKPIENYFFKKLFPFDNYETTSDYKTIFHEATELTTDDYNAINNRYCTSTCKIKAERNDGMEVELMNGTKTTADEYSSFAKIRVKCKNSVPVPMPKTTCSPIPSPESIFSAILRCDPVTSKFFYEVNSKGDEEIKTFVDEVKCIDMCSFNDNQVTGVDHVKKVTYSYSNYNGHITTHKEFHCEDGYEPDGVDQNTQCHTACNESKLWEQSSVKCKKITTTTTTTTSTTTTTTTTAPVGKSSSKPKVTVSYNTTTTIDDYDYDYTADGTNPTKKASKALVFNIVFISLLDMLI